MKTFLFSALLMASATVFAGEATVNLLGILPQGEYYGTTPDSNEACSVTVEIVGSQVVITAATDAAWEKTSVLRNSVFRWNPGNRSFLSSRYLDSNTETIFRTVSNGDDSQYVVVANVVDGSESRVECNVNY